MRGAFGSSSRAQLGVRRVQRQRQRRLDAALRQPLEHARVADRREHQVLVADAALRAEQLDGLEHVVEVVRRLAHAHEHDLLHGAPRARQRHLRDDLGAADLAQQAVAAGHAEHAADRAADLRRHAQAVARQQHALHRLAVGELDEQARRAVVAPGCSERTRAKPVQFVGQRPAAPRQGRAAGSLLGMARPLSSGRLHHRRSTRSSWTGLAPQARRRWRMSSMRMGKKDDERASVVRRPRARGGGQAYSRPP
jgi:hypothetical protein